MSLIFTLTVNAAEAESSSDALSVTLPVIPETTTMEIEPTTANTSTPLNGLVTMNGTTMYFVDGRPYSGFQKINGNKYYFSSTGNMATGLQKIGKYYYYFGNDGVMQTGFITRIYNGSLIKTYHNKKGRMKTGSFKVGKVKYKASKKTGAIYSIRNVAKPINQNPQLPTGCEITSWTMMVKYAGVKMNKLKAANIMPKSSNPNKGFVGSPYSKSGRGLIIYPDGLKNITKKYLGNYVNMTGCNLNYIKSKLWSKHLVLVWVTRLDGFGSHTIALTGYDKTGFFYNDPWTGTRRKIKYNYFKTIWRENGYRAMSY